MSGTEQEIDFLTYCKLAANVYPDGKDDHNLLSSASENWQKMPLSISGQNSEGMRSEKVVYSIYKAYTV